MLDFDEGRAKSKVPIAGSNPAEVRDQGREFKNCGRLCARTLSSVVTRFRAAWLATEMSFGSSFSGMRASKWRRCRNEATFRHSFQDAALPRTSLSARAIEISTSIAFCRLLALIASAEIAWTSGKANILLFGALLVHSEQRHLAAPAERFSQQILGELGDGLALDPNPTPSWVEFVDFAVSQGGQRRTAHLG